MGSFCDAFQTESGDWVPCPIFNGSNLSSWISSMEDFLVRFQIPDIQWVNFASYYVLGDAYSWVILNENCVSWWNWAQFTAAISIQFDQVIHCVSRHVRGSCLKNASLKVQNCSGKEEGRVLNAGCYMRTTEEDMNKAGVSPKDVAATTKDKDDGCESLKKDNGQKIEDDVQSKKTGSGIILSQPFDSLSILKNLIGTSPLRSFGNLTTLIWLYTTFFNSKSNFDNIMNLYQMYKSYMNPRVEIVLHEYDNSWRHNKLYGFVERYLRDSASLKASKLKANTERGDKPFALTIDAGGGGGGGRRLGIILAGAGSTFAAVMIIATCIFFEKRKFIMRKDKRKRLGALALRVKSSNLNFKYEVFEKAPNYFNNSNKLGQGGSGSVLLDDRAGFTVLLDDRAGFTGEKTAVPNRNSARGFDVVDNIKSAVEKVCPGVVSCADILVIAACDSVVTLGGPTWNVKLGRRDSRTASRSAANNNIPPPTSNLNNLISSFQAQGLSARDMVVLSGSHTIGQARCTSFRPRIDNETNFDRNLALTRQRSCPRTAGSGDNNIAPLDTQTPTAFDNNYHKNLVSQRGLLHSDQQLFNGGSTDGFVRTYSDSIDTFNTDFVAAFQHLRKLDAVFGCNRSAKVAFSPSMHPSEEALAEVKTIFVEGLTDSWDEEKLKQLCEQYGQVEKVQLSRDLATVKRKDFGFVTFTLREYALACVTAINNAEIGEGDVKVKANLAKPKYKGKLGKKATRGGYRVPKDGEKIKESGKSKASGDSKSKEDKGKGKATPKSKSSKGGKQPQDKTAERKDASAEKSQPPKGKKRDGKMLLQSSLATRLSRLEDKPAIKGRGVYGVYEDQDRREDPLNDIQWTRRQVPPTDDTCLRTSMWSRGVGC